MPLTTRYGLAAAVITALDALDPENTAIRAELAQLRATRAAACGAMRIQGDQLRAGRAE